jgi:hypothetical protein
MAALLSACSPTTSPGQIPAPIITPYTTAELATAIALSQVSVDSQRVAEAQQLYTDAKAVEVIAGASTDQAKIQAALQVLIAHLNQQRYGPLIVILLQPTGTPTTQPANNALVQACQGVEMAAVLYGAKQ